MANLTRATIDLIKGTLKDRSIKYLSSLVNSVARSLLDRLDDSISVNNFGADPSGSTMSTLAFQKALDACSDKTAVELHGRALYIPGGNYKIDEGLTYSWRNGSSLTDGDTRRLSIIGDGRGCTFINDVRANPGIVPLITFDGGQADPFLRLSISNIRFQRPSYDMLGWGLYFKNVAIMDVRNVDSQWFLNGAVCHDVLYAKFDHCQFGANDMGIRLAKLNWTRPNVILFDQCMFGGNRSGCADFVDGSNIKFDTCSFEGTGTSKSGSQRCIQYTGAPEEGGIGLTVVNCYFENNFVYADIAIESNSATIGTHIIEGNTFQRTSPTRHCKVHINLSPNNPNGKQRIHLRANTYKFLGGYTHQSGDGSVFVQSDWAEVKEEGNLYNPLQLPVYTGRVVDGYNNKIVCTAKVSPATPSVIAGYNAASVARLGVGIYKITFTKQVTSANLVAIATVEGGIGSASITGYDETSVTVTIQDNTWTATNALAFNLVVTGIML